MPVSLVTRTPKLLVVCSAFFSLDFFFLSFAFFPSLLSSFPCASALQSSSATHILLCSETATKTGLVMIFGEITTSAKIDYDAVVRAAIKKIGYDSKDKGLDYRTVRSCSVLLCVCGEWRKRACA
jgi:S-adenosylmethionine synthetase